MPAPVTYRTFHAAAHLSSRPDSRPAARVRLVSAFAESIRTPSSVLLLAPTGAAVE